MDKRDLSELFRTRLQTLLDRSEENQAAFAAAVGIDRSALSQLLSGRSTRLPRAETLLAIAETHGVSLDWLLGISQDEGLIGQLKPSLEIEEGPEGFDRTLLAKWHAEAAGTKIRYVPARIPDLLRTEAVITYEAEAAQRNSASERDEVAYRIDYNRRPETDMEICMPVQTLELFAEGRGLWSGLPREARAQQLAHMAGLVEELYPSFRLYLFDGRQRFSIPYTIFGPYRAAIYVGDMYLVLNTREAVRTMTRHFDGLIRIAKVNAHEAAAHVGHLAVG